MKKILLIAASLLAVSAAHADVTQPVYGEVAYVASTYSDSDISVRPGVLRGIAGIEYNSNLAFEAMVGAGVRDGSFGVGGYTADVSVDYAIGAYIKPKLALTPDLELFGRVGFVRAKLSASVAGMSVSTSGSDVSFGIGLKYAIAPAWSANLDYMSYGKIDGTKGSGVGLGVSYKF